MDQRRKQLQSTGICHKLFYFMKSLASQAAKPITCYPPIISQQTRRPSDSRFDEPSNFRINARGIIGSTEGVDDSEGLASIEIEDETCVLLDQGKIMGENGSKTRTPRKMVSIKDEPEIIGYPNKKRRKNERQMSSMEGGNDVVVRPLRSILKVGSKLR